LRNAFDGVEKFAFHYNGRNYLFFLPDFRFTLPLVRSHDLRKVGDEMKSFSAECSVEVNPQAFTKAVKIMEGSIKNGSVTLSISGRKLKIVASSPSGRALDLTVAETPISKRVDVKIFAKTLSTLSSIFKAPFMVSFQGSSILFKQGDTSVLVKACS
jgi:hypothetical protein